MPTYVTFLMHTVNTPSFYSHAHYSFWVFGGLFDLSNYIKQWVRLFSQGIVNKLFDIVTDQAAGYDCHLHVQLNIRVTLQGKHLPLRQCNSAMGMVHYTKKKIAVTIAVEILNDLASHIEECRTALMVC